MIIIPLFLLDPPSGDNGSSNHHGYSNYPKRPSRIKTFFKNLPYLLRFKPCKHSGQYVIKFKWYSLFDQINKSEFTKYKCGNTLCFKCSVCAKYIKG